MKKQLDVPFTNYWITNDGRIWSDASNKYLSSFVNNSGYECASLCDGTGKNHKFLIHRLVAEAFVENPDPFTFTCVDHIDGNKRNNQACSLRWVDYRGNLYYAQLEGKLHDRGRHPYELIDHQTGRSIYCLYLKTAIAISGRSYPYMTHILKEYFKIHEEPFRLNERFSIRIAKERSIEEFNFAW